MTQPTGPAAAPGARQRTRRRLLAALALIAAAVAALALFEHYRLPRWLPPAPHEPSQALIVPPAPPAPAGASGVAPEIATQAPPDAKDGGQASPAPPPPEPASARPEPLFLVQAGVFASPANAAALQKKLAGAGLRATLVPSTRPGGKVETRVQLGPYKDRRKAEQVSVRLRKLGMEAIVVKAR